MDISENTEYGKWSRCCNFMTFRSTNDSKDLRFPLEEHFNLEAWHTKQRIFSNNCPLLSIHTKASNLTGELRKHKNEKTPSVILARRKGHDFRRYKGLTVFEDPSPGGSRFLSTHVFGLARW
ncbi:uncharacterized protein LOC143303342 isoform X1 [Bombus vancouverensis nearcticus]|uniref:uncharacterized protein LOC143303342 isoform X1 n=1 Tax=Bombus vancouverensis nearcticus TaxID=2705178 RepID=UPI00402B1BE5